MQIPTDTLKKWKSLRSAGDAAKIIDTMNLEVSDETINRAFREKKCSDSVFEALAKFYAEKDKTFKEALSS